MRGPVRLCVSLINGNYFDWKIGGAVSASLQLFDRKYHPTWEACSGGGALACHEATAKKILLCFKYIKTDWLEMLLG
jgi:hypothetical protein